MHDVDRRQAVPLAHFKVIGIVAGVTLTTPVPNSGSTKSSSNYGQPPLQDRQYKPLALQVRVAFIAGVDGHGHIPKERFRTGRSHTIASFFCPFFQR